MMLEATSYEPVVRCLLRPDMITDQPISSPRAPLAETLTKIRKRMEQFKGQPDFITKILTGFEDYVLGVGMGCFIPKIIQGVVIVPMVSDCLGVLVGSIHADGSRRLGALHIPVYDGYSIEDVKKLITCHQGAQSISLAVVGAEINQQVVDQLGLKINLPIQPPYYKTLIDELLGPNVAITRCTVKLKTSPPNERVRGKFTAYTLTADVNSPLDITTFSWRLG